MNSDAFVAEHTVQPSTEAGMSLQNPYCVRYTVAGRMIARQGAMVAYRGDLTIRTKSQGVRKLAKRAVTGEGLGLMEVEGKGEIWLADLAKNVFILNLSADEAFSVTGKAVLCFDPSLHYDIRLVKGGGMPGGGLFNSAFSGEGSVAVTSHGQPMAIPVTPEQPVLVDVNAVIGWSDKLEASIHRSEGIKSFVKGGSGEIFQLRLQGEGLVLVQPSEGPSSDPKSHGVADAIGGLFGG